MTTSSFLRLADGGEVRFDFSASEGRGTSSLAYQLFAADGHEVGPVQAVADDGQGIDSFRAVEAFNAAALSGGGFVLAYEERHSVVIGPGPTESLTLLVKGPGGEQSVFQLPIGQNLGADVHFGAPGVFGLSGSAFGVVFERHDGAAVSEHLALPGTGNAFTDIALLDIALPGVPNSVSTADGNLTLGFADGRRVLAGGNVRGELTGGSGDDTAIAGAGGDVVRGGDGDDRLQGGSGFDDLNGGQGNDTLIDLQGGDDWLVGGQGDDLISAQLGANILLGNLGADTLQGGSGAEILRGGQGDDSIAGGGGGDFISGDRGADTESGGAGADVFHTAVGAGVDRVLDFHLSEGDRVQLDPGTAWTVSQVGADTVIDLGDGDRMILVGVQMATLTGDWIFAG